MVGFVFLALHAPRLPGEAHVARGLAGYRAMRRLRRVAEVGFERAHMINGDAEPKRAISQFERDAGGRQSSQFSLRRGGAGESRAADLFRDIVKSVHVAQDTTTCPRCGAPLDSDWYCATCSWSKPCRVRRTIGEAEWCW